MSLSKMSFKMQFIDQCIVIIVCKRNNTKLQTTASYAKEKTFHYIQRLVNKCTHTCFVLNKNVKVRVRSLYFLLQPTSSFNWLTTGLNKIKGFHYTYIIIYIYIHIYVHMCVCIYACMYAYVFIHLCPLSPHLWVRPWGHAARNELDRIQASLLMVKHKDKLWNGGLAITTEGNDNHGAVFCGRPSSSLGNWGYLCYGLKRVCLVSGRGERDE